MNQIALALLFLAALALTLGLVYIQIVGIYNSFKAHVGYGLVSLFVGPFALAIGAIKVFTGQNILIKKGKKA
jgi:hypothetical protein